MREILFRGKRMDNGEWVEGTPFHRKMFYGSPDDRYFMLTGEEFHYDYYEAYEVDPATVGQFTGLLDKNGKRIFEGDIVRLFFIDTEEVGEIVWDEERCQVAYMSPDVEIYGVDGTVEIEIIGNIHDNPELLEVNEDG